jgi:transposase
MRSLAYDTQQNILSLLGQGLSTRQIARQCNATKSTVQKLRKKHLPGLPLSRGGRPEKLSPQDKRFCVRAVTSGRIDTAVAAAERLREKTKMKVSKWTVRRVLQKAGLKSQKKEKKPKLSAKNIKARLDFANQYRDWTVADWMHVIWTDETKVDRFCSDGQSWCWVRDGESRQPRQVKQTVKHGGGSLMIWGCMTAHGPGFLCRIMGTMDQHLYKLILEEDLQKTIEFYDMDAEQVVFQHDNDPKHKAKSVQEWLSEQPFEVMKFPAQSPDLNPIENLWALLKQRLNRYETPPSGMIELWDRVKSEFYNISTEECLKLYESMPSRIDAVLKAKGMWTDY